jgi:hypothetical protein|tara:strand:- start:918 stop:1553 length:636 start_codon:yes stop_codon:yes gene_type:complete
MATYSSIKYNFTPPTATTSAQVGAGAMTLIKTIDSDGSDATISFVDGSSSVVLDNTYKTYVFELIGIHPESDDAYLKFQCSIDTGSNYNVACTSTFAAAYQLEDDSDGGGPNYDGNLDLAQGTGFMAIGYGGSNLADACEASQLWLFNPSDTTFVKHFMLRGSGNLKNSIHGNNHNIAAGYFNTTSAIDAIQFKYATDEIQGGSIKMYGIA